MLELITVPTFMEQGVIPSLEMIFSYLELLHDETDYYVEVSEPGGGAGDQDSEIWEERLALRLELTTLGRVLS